MSFARRVFAFLQFMVLASFTACKTPADIVFATSTPLTVAIPGWIASKVRRTDFVFEVRDLWPGVPVEMGILRNPIAIWLARKLEAFSYKAAERVIALSPDMAEGVRQTNPKSRVTVVPNACDFELFGERNDAVSRDKTSDVTESRPKRLVYAGSLGASYDPEWIASFASVATQRGLTLEIIGDGAGYELIKNKLQAADIDPDSVLLGAMPKLQVRKHLWAADATLSSLAPFKCLEANSLNKVFDSLAASRPVITNHGGWLADLLEEHGAGVRVPRDEEQAVNNVVNWFKEPAFAEKSLAAGSLGRAYFDRDVLYERFEHALLGQRG